MNSIKGNNIKGMTSMAIVSMYGKRDLQPILDTIENEDMMTLAHSLMMTIPEYFYSVPASSTGKYHPEYTCGNGGLLRHTLAVVQLANHMFDMDPSAFTSRERDMIRIAGMMHDTRKSGTQEDFYLDPHTKFEHPILAADAIISVSDIIPMQELQCIADMVACHMGRWNTRDGYTLVLPIPSTPMEILLHTCDFLASRKDITIVTGK